MLFFLRNAWTLIALIAFCKGKKGHNDENLMVMLNYVGSYPAGGYTIGQGHKWGFHRLSAFPVFTWVMLLSVSLINI